MYKKHRLLQDFVDIW